MTTYNDISRILIDNSIPFKVVTYVGGFGKEDRITGFEVYKWDMPLNYEEDFLRNLLAGEQCKIISNVTEEIINITI